MYKAVIFDFGNVLCGLDRMAFARAAAPYSGLPAEEFDPRDLGRGDRT